MCSRLGLGGLAPLVWLTFVPLARLRREGRLGLNPTSEESSRVLMAYFMLETLREGRVLESRRELQEKGVLEVDCPVCLGCLAGVNGVVTFHVLQCGHRCEDARTCTAPPRPRACVDADAKVDHLTRARARSHCIRRRVHEECLLKLEKTPETGGGFGCPLCRGTSYITQIFVMKGALV